MTPVCSSCGVVAPTMRAVCESCSRPLPQPRVFAPETGAFYFVAVRAGFKCRACDFNTPLDGLVSSESIDCAQCGSLQRFDRSAWTDGLAHARAVGDLAGPSPEGRSPSPVVWIGDDNQLGAVGVSETFARSITDRFALDASPGWPVCRKCASLLECTGRGTTIATRCPRCGMVAQYGLPPEIGAAAPFLVAVVSEENRVDRREVCVQATAVGPVALLCPQCGAAVQSVDGNTVECSYCRTIAIIPPRARPRDKGSIVQPAVFWVAFLGRSPERERLEAPVPPAEPSGNLLALPARGLSPLRGIELAPVRPGLDVRQFLFTLATTVAAVGLGYICFLFARG